MGREDGEAEEGWKKSSRNNGAPGERGEFRFGKAAKAKDSAVELRSNKCSGRIGSWSLLWWYTLLSSFLFFVEFWLSWVVESEEDAPGQGVVDPDVFKRAEADLRLLVFMLRQPANLGADLVRWWRLSFDRYLSFT